LSITGPDIHIELPKKEFLLLFKLLSYPKKIFTRQQLMSEIWGLDTDIDERTVDSHIKKLRKKFEDRPEFKIITIRGLGYKAEKIHD
jgi:two-component system, OmpR family, response regulator